MSQTRHNDRKGIDTTNNNISIWTQRYHIHALSDITETKRKQQGIRAIGAKRTYNFARPATVQKTFSRHPINTSKMGKPFFTRKMRGMEYTRKATRHRKICCIARPATVKRPSRDINQHKQNGKPFFYQEIGKCEIWNMFNGGDTAPEICCNS